MVNYNGLMNAVLKCVCAVQEGGSERVNGSRTRGSAFALRFYQIIEEKRI